MYLSFMCKFKLFIVVFVTLFFIKYNEITFIKCIDVGVLITQTNV